MGFSEMSLGPYCVLVREPGDKYYRILVKGMTENDAKAYLAKIKPGKPWHGMRVHLTADTRRIPGQRIGGAPAVDVGASKLAETWE